ncbi:hypothetical protein [Planotetraspora sp. GP83]
MMESNGKHVTRDGDLVGSAGGRTEKDP